MRSGGRFARREDPGVLASRTNYFRATYAYDRPETPGIEPFLLPRGLRSRPRARSTAVRSSCPNIVYANLLLPGQELAVHTDVPEFRGANRKRYPQWLIVVMLHSGLFEPLAHADRDRRRLLRRRARAASSPSTRTGPTARRARSR